MKEEVGGTEGVTVYNERNAVFVSDLPPMATAVHPDLVPSNFATFFF